VASVDLLFDKTPVAGPPWNLLFGELAGPAPSRTLDLAASFADLTFAGLARSIISLTMGLSFPEMVLAASALYQSKTARAIVSKTVAGWQKGVVGEFGVAGPHRVAAPRSLGTQERWTPGVPFLMGSAVPQLFALKLDTRNESLFDSALRRHLDPVRMVYQEADRSARLNLGTSFQVANRLGAARVRDLFSVGVGHPVLLDSRWNKPIEQRLGTVNSAGRALPRNLGWAVAFQEGMRPRAGRTVPSVPPVPPPFDPCYLPDSHLLFDAAWSSDLGLIFICERHPAPVPLPTGGTVVVPIRRIYMVVNNASLRRVDGNISLPTFSMTLKIDADSWTWSFGAILPGSALPSLEPAFRGDPVEVEAMVNGVAYRALVERIERSREFGRSDLRVTGRGKTALLDAPYAPVRNFSNSQARTAQQLMADVLTLNGVPLGWDVQWGLVDWLVPTGVFSHQGTYIGALNQIAAAAGGYVQPHASTQMLKVLPRYPSVPWEWDSVVPDFELPADVTSRESIQWLEKPAYNRVFVSGQEVGVLTQVTRAGTAGDVLAPMVVDALITQAAAARQRGIAILADTGRQIELSLRLPVLAETGIIAPGAFVAYRDGSVTRRGLVRSTQVQVGLPEVWQTLGVQAYA
jgi:hypothetical protein